MVFTDEYRTADSMWSSIILQQDSIGIDRFLFRWYPIRNPTEKNPTKQLSDPINFRRKASYSELIRHRILSDLDGIYKSDRMTWVVNWPLEKCTGILLLGHNSSPFWLIFNLFLLVASRDVRDQLFLVPVPVPVTFYFWSRFRSCWSCSSIGPGPGPGIHIFLVPIPVLVPVWREILQNLFI